MTETQPITEPGQDTTWRLEGALTIYTVETLRTQMIERLSKPGGLNLDLSAVDSCDCAGLQLLCSARKHPLAPGASFQVDNFSPAIVTAAEGIGLDLSPLKTTPSQARV